MIDHLTLECRIVDQPVSEVRIGGEKFSTSHTRGVESPHSYLCPAGKFPAAPIRQKRAAGALSTPAALGRVQLEESACQSSNGPMIWANRFRALFNRLLTVPRLQSVISAISS